jgi:predicted dehydrogenase
VLAPPESFGGWPEWRYYRPYAGGMMTDFGAHHFDIAQWGLGRDGSAPVDIIPPDGKDYTTLTYKYDDGITMYHGGGEEKAAVEWIGTEGRVSVNRGQYLKTEPAHLANEFIGPNVIRLYDSKNHKDNWLEAIRTRKEPICPAEIGQSTAIVCHIGNIAYWLKRPLKWDPAKREFVNDAEANRLLMRPMRAPWQLADV